MSYNVNIRIIGRWSQIKAWTKINMIDVDGKDYFIAIVNCVNEKVVGFNFEIKDVSAACPKDWSKSNEVLEIGYYAKTPGEKIYKLDLRKLKLP